jgi:predicted transposase YbfD/YdcC
MAAISAVSIKQHSARLKDPRVRRHRRHRLLDIIVIAICGVIADCDTWQDIEVFGQQRVAWLRRFLSLRNGIPSHDTFERVFDRIDPQVFAGCFCQWVQALSETLGLPQIAIDGKTLRRSFARSKKWRPLHLVSAWSTQQHLTLGQVAVERKSNEIEAIPRLLELLDLHGALVTLDAMGCQKVIAAKIVSGGGDYVLTVKENQEHLLDDIQETVQQALDDELPPEQISAHTTVEDGHGRHEERSYLVVTSLETIRDRSAWPKLKVVGMCSSERSIAGKTTVETRYFIGSRRMSAKRYGVALRNHWRIENSLHWQLDVTFSEDDSRVQKRHGAANLALLRRGAISLLKQNRCKRSLRGQRKMAAGDTAFLQQTLHGSRALAKL